MRLVYIVGVTTKPTHAKIRLAKRLRWAGLSLSQAWPLAKGRGVEIPANMVRPVADMVSASRDVADMVLHDGERYVFGRGV